VKLLRNTWIVLSPIQKSGRDRSEDIDFDQVELEKARDYGCEDADVTLQLARLLFPKLKEGGFKTSLDQVEMPLVMVLAKWR